MSILLQYRAYLKAVTKIYTVQANIGQHMLKYLLKLRQDIKEVNDKNLVQTLKFKFNQTYLAQSPAKTQQQRIYLINKKINQVKRVKILKIQDMAQILNAFTSIIHRSMDKKQNFDARKSYQKKIIRIAANLSEFITNKFKLRDDYQMPQLQGLKKDIQYQQLNQRQKQFVRKTIIHICCGKRSMQKYKHAIQYIKDFQSQRYEKRYNIFDIEKQHNYNIQENREFILNVASKKIPNNLIDLSESSHKFCLSLIEKTIIKKEQQKNKLKKSIEKVYNEQLQQRKAQFYKTFEGFILVDSISQRQIVQREFIQEFINSRIIIV